MIPAPSRVRRRIVWRDLPAERRVLFSPAGFRPVDDLTGQAPGGPLEVSLDVQDGTGWRVVDRPAVTTASGVLIFPGLGHGADLTQPPQLHRLRLHSAVYRPLYRAAADGVTFAVEPWDDAHPPANPTTRTEALVLVPGPAYPFAPFLAVLRGKVVDANGAPVPDVLVQEGLNERSLTDERGTFALALRWVKPGVQTTITATDQRGGRGGTLPVTLPAALAKSQTITVT